MAARASERRCDGRRCGAQDGRRDGWRGARRGNGDGALRWNGDAAGAIGQRVTCLAQGLHEASRIFEKIAIDENPGEEAGRLIGRLTARGGIRRTAASRREMRALVEGGGDGELIPRLGLERGDTTAAGSGDEIRRDADADEREKGQRGAGLGLADTERNCDTHVVTRDPKVASDARAAALCGGGRRRHGAEAKEKAGGWGGGSRRVKGAQGGWRHEELTRGKPMAVDFDGDRRRRGKRESGGSRRGLDSGRREHHRDRGNAFPTSDGAEGH
uniref:Uncharacterized protein n=1 Tax=Oryza sativa subsp. japonica TaxID=39947 RepID=Q7XEE1_ORYSJ|nr:hypothetical protein LOC_Os10g29040 [Oryza sativa Japonica Group]